MPTEIFIVPTITGFICSTDADVEVKRKFKLGEPIKAVVSKPRKIRFHNKFFKLLQIVHENLPESQWTLNGSEIIEIRTVKDLLWHVKMQAGHYERKVTLGGKIVYEAKSINFGAMDEIEFNNFYDAAIDIIIKYFLPVDRQDLIDMVAQEF